MVYQIRGYVLADFGNTSAQYRNSLTGCECFCTIRTSESVSEYAREEVATDMEFLWSSPATAQVRLLENTIDVFLRCSILTPVHMDGYANYFAFRDTFAEIAEIAVSRQTYQILLTHRSLRAEDMRLTVKPVGDDRINKTTSSGFDFDLDFDSDKGIDFCFEDYIAPGNRFEAVVSHMTYIRENCG